MKHLPKTIGTIIGIAVLCIGIPAILRPIPVEAACSTSQSGSDYTISSNCNFDNAVDGLDNGTSTGANTTHLIISASTLTLSDSQGGAQTLAVGSFTPANGGSVIIPTGSKIVLGSALVAQDQDGDGIPDTTTYTVGQPTGSLRRIAELNFGRVDCDDTQAAVSYTGSCYLDDDLDGKSAGTAYTCMDTSSCATAKAGDKGSGTAVKTYAVANHWKTSQDNDCNDADASVYQTATTYTDADGDGYGAGTGGAQCIGAAPPAGKSLSGTDCDDAHNTVYQTKTCYFDNDNDGAYDTSGTSTCTGATCSTIVTAGTPTYWDTDTFEAGPGSADDWFSRNGNDPDITNTTAYAGTYSLHFAVGAGGDFEQPSTYESGQTSAGFSTATYPYMCMAYKIPATTTTNMLFRTTAGSWYSLTINNREYNPTYPKKATWGPITADNAWHYKCINFNAQLVKSLGSSQTIDSLIFYTGDNTHLNSGEFWIDNFAITNTNLMNNTPSDTVGDDCANSDVDHWQNTTAYYDGDADLYPTASSQTRCTGWDPSNTSSDAYDRSPGTPTDCCDTDNRAFPGQTTKYSTPMTGGCSYALTYDFNCDGVQTQNSTTVVTGTGNATSCTADATCTGLCGVTNVPGWMTSAPACGASGTWCASGGSTNCLCSSYDIYNPGTCYSGTLSCSGSSTVAQTCL